MAWEELGTVAGRLLARLQTLQANDNEKEKPRLRLIMQPGECAGDGMACQRGAGGIFRGGSKGDAGNARQAPRRAGMVGEPHDEAPPTGGGTERSGAPSRDDAPEVPASAKATGGKVGEGGKAKKSAGVTAPFVAIMMD